MISILLVDDELDILDSMKALLEEENYQVYTASDGRIAMGILKNIPVDLVVSDVMMPFLSGYELVAWMRSEANLSHTPCLLISCVLPKVSRRKFQWDDFLKKPFSTDEFLESVNRCLDAESSTLPDTQTAIL